MTDRATPANSALVRAARGLPVPHTPVWFMRQAGRSLPEYREIRVGNAMLEACATPDLVTEITLQPVRRHGVDAAIFFSDIVVPLKAIGVDLDIVPGTGPVVAEPIRTRADLDRLPELTTQRCEAYPEMTVAERYAYFFGTMILIAPTWYLATLAGALVGQAIPEALALDFAMPITFLAMIAPMLKTLPHVVAALTSIGLALALAGLPHGAGLMVAALAAMVAGAGAETWLARRGQAA